MARSSWLTALACAAVAVNAARCPKFEDVAALSGPVGRFDLNKYVGGASDYWYEVASHNLPVLTTGCQCTRYNNSRINDVDWTDVFECRKKSPSAKPTTFTSVGHASSSPNATLGGAMTETFTVGSLAHSTQAYWVLDVVEGAGDTAAYKHALVYACSSVLGVRSDFVYFFSRSPAGPGNDTLAKWRQWPGIDTTSVRPVPQDGCGW